MSQHSDTPHSTLQSRPSALCGGGVTTCSLPPSLDGSADTLLAEPRSWSLAEPLTERQGPGCQQPSGKSQPSKPDDTRHPRTPEPGDCEQRQGRAWGGTDSEPWAMGGQSPGRRDADRGQNELWSEHWREVGDVAGGGGKEGNQVGECARKPPRIGLQGASGCALKAPGLSRWWEGRQGQRKDSCTVQHVAWQDPVESNRLQARSHRQKT